MNIFVKIILAIFVVLGVSLVGLYLYVGPDPVVLQEGSLVENVTIQPKGAIEIAQPFLEEHGTYNWNPEKEMNLHILKQGNWYYIMQTNYPAKTSRYYLQPAIKVHVDSGDVEFSER